MRLISTCFRTFVLATFLLGMAIAAPTASAAEWTNHSGTVCKNYNASEVSYIDYFSNGTRNLSTSATTTVICPLSRNTTGTYGAYFYVHVSGSQSTTCTAYSHTYDGMLLASTSNSGIGEIPLDLYGFGNSNTYSNYSVLCDLPANRLAVLNTVDLYEY